jgi:DNA mismatch repair protein MutS
MMRERLVRPLRELGTIGTRQAIVAELTDNSTPQACSADVLGRLPDLERVAGRAAAGRNSAENLRALADIDRQLTALAPLTSSTDFLSAPPGAAPADGDAVC